MPGNLISYLIYVMMNNNTGFFFYHIPNRADTFSGKNGQIDHVRPILVDHLIILNN